MKYKIFKCINCSAEVRTDENNPYYYNLNIALPCPVCNCYGFEDFGEHEKND